MIVVSDTSAITALLQVNHVALLQQLYGEVLIPEAVRDELRRTHPSLPSFLRCRRVSNSALAKECGADVLLMDDLEGRRVARREGVPFIGLLGVLVQAKQMGRIASVRQLTTELERVAEFRLSAEVKEIAFRKAGE